MRRVFVSTLLLLLALPAQVLAQTSNASVSGFVQDATGAFIPGVTVTATNTATGITATVVSNESGSYTILSLLPGTYTLAAELPGFRSQVYNQVQLGAGATARYNFRLEVGEVAQAIEVVADTSQLLVDTSSSVGQVLPEEQVRDLPLISNNVLDLMKTMAGVRGEGLGESTTFAGVSTALVNTVRDGLSVQEGRYTAGVGATTLVNPDMVGEFRVVLTPVDAEMGRGNGQVQILTKSGTNEFHGTAVWSVRNSALDANTWANNKQIIRGVWSPGASNWYNRHQATASLGGPIVENKTFFFALYDQQFERQRVQMRPIVLTECARNGIFRYWESWTNGNINQVTTRAGANPTIASVDSFGNPLRPETNPNGLPYTGELQYFSVFGPLLNTPTQPDCSDAVVQGAPWNALRSGMDPSGISQSFIDAMPPANIFDGGDGLNTGVHQWQRSGRNGGAFSLATGQNTDTPRKQINAKVDHNFNSNHKVAVNFSYEWVDGDYIPTPATQTIWPGGFASEIVRRPKVLTVNFTSTLSPSVLNEARFGYRANKHVIWAPWEVTDESLRDVPLSFLQQGGQGFPVAYVPAAVGGMTGNNYFCITNCAQQGNTTPLWNFADTISWTHGTHDFKGGFDYRYAYTSGSETPTAPIPKATGGAGLNPNQAFRGNTAMPGLTTGNEGLANNLLYFLAGSINSAQQYYFIQTPDDLTQWENYLTINRKITEPHQNDWAAFFKDDWKVTPSLTLNLGLRYEYYGVPYEGNGLTVVPVGGGSALFGVSGRSFENWMRPDNGVDLNLLTTMEFVGPGTSNPNGSVYDKDFNNFGPAIGFAWQLPWFGAGKTNVRGGYQITYAGAGRLGNYSNSLFSNPGFLHLAQTSGPVDGSYFDVSDLSDIVPVPPSVLPMQPFPLLKTNQSISAFDENYETPYIQNFTLSITREVTRSLSVDLRYVGTRGVGLLGVLNLNAPNVFFNPDLMAALETTRMGGNADIFDQMFLGLNLAPNVRGCDPANPNALCAPIDGVTQRGSAHMRLSSTFQTPMANGDYVNIANTVNLYNGVGSSAVPGIPGERGTVLRRANRGFNVPGGTDIPGGPVVPAGLFPENWIVANPQFNLARFWSNTAKSNYHSFQAQATLRPTRGLSFQGTYVWSKAFELPTVGVSGGLTSTDPVYTDPTERELDYALASSHVSHDFRSYGVFELPFGPGRMLLGDSTGWVARLVEGWQTSFIVNLSTGGTTSVQAANMLYGRGVPDIVGPFPERSGEVAWHGDYGSYFGEDTFTKVADPQCSAIAAGLQRFCTLQAVADASGQIVLQNPSPGRRGTLGLQTMELPGSWSFDAALAKSVQVNETMDLQVRVDAINVLNHPAPGSPVLNINSVEPFGFIQEKGNQHRQFRGQVRLSF